MTKEIQSLEGSEFGQPINWVVGQQVIVYGGGAMRWKQVRKIDRITDGRGGTIYVGRESYDSSGHQRGGDVWSRQHIQIATEKLLLEVRSEYAKMKLRKFDWDSLPDWAALKVVEVLMAMDKRINFKENKFVPNPEMKEV